MKIIRYPAKEQWPALIERAAEPQEDITGIVQTILDDVKLNGDAALKKLTLKFDQVEVDSLRIEETCAANAQNQLSQELRSAILLAKKNIETFHAAQLTEAAKIETTTGVTCWRKSVPISPIGIYIPGGTAPLFSTILMLAAPARLAGCEQIVFCSPPNKNGELDPAILFTARLFGITEIFRVGGAQAIAAMAYGTETIPRVNKIFGPGNQFVTTAKQLLSRQQTAIDLPAGPSELAIIADQSCNPAYVAADLLSQAEHGIDSQVMLISSSEQVLVSVRKEIMRQLESLPRKQIAAQALDSSRAILTQDFSEAMAFVNFYAPEHLIIATDNPEDLVDDIKNAGSVFLGHYATEPLGDYASGTNHVLPTAGYAKAYSGVSIDSFVKKITFQEVSKVGIQTLGDAVCEMAVAEDLEAHAQAVRLRLKDIADV